MSDDTVEDAPCRLCQDLDLLHYPTSAPPTSRPFCSSCGRTLPYELVDYPDTPRPFARPVR